MRCFFPQVRLHPFRPQLRADRSSPALRSAEVKDNRTPLVLAVEAHRKRKKKDKKEKEWKDDSWCAGAGADRPRPSRVLLVSFSCGIFRFGCSTQLVILDVVWGVFRHYLQVYSVCIF